MSKKTFDINSKPQTGVVASSMVIAMEEQKDKAIIDHIQGWDDKFIKLAEHIATWSKDRSTNVGAVIVNSERRVVSMGYNGFPSGADDNIERRHQRPQKYLYTEHAERNAIYNALRIHADVNGCRMYVTMFPCADCARAIIQSGITAIVCPGPSDDPNWEESFEVSLELFNECGINFKFI